MALTNELPEDDIRRLVESVEEVEEEPLKDQVMRLIKVCVGNFERALGDRDTELETRIEIARVLVEINSCVPDEESEEEIFQRTGGYPAT